MTSSPRPTPPAGARGVRQTARRFTAVVRLICASMEAEELEKEAVGQEPLEGTDQKAEAEEEQEESEEAACGAKKRVVPGIVYLGHLPPRFRPLHVRNLLSAFGEVGRVFFQPEGKSAGPGCSGRGWVPWRGARALRGHGAPGRRPTPLVISGALSFQEAGSGVDSSVTHDE